MNAEQQSDRLNLESLLHDQSDKALKWADISATVDYIRTLPPDLVNAIKNIACHVSLAWFSRDDKYAEHMQELAKGACAELIDRIGLIQQQEADR